MLDKIGDYIFGVSDKSQLSISRILLEFYLLIGANYIAGLYAKQMGNFIKDNRYAQHIIGFLLMFVLITNTSKLKNQTNIFFYAILGYILFTFSTKVDLPWNFAIIGLLLVGYLYEHRMKNKEKDSEDDQALEDVDKKKITKKNNFNRLVVIVSIAIVIIIGTSMYFNKKQIQYGDKFDMTKFVFNGHTKYRLVK